MGPLNVSTADAGPIELTRSVRAFPPEPPGYDRPAEWKPVSAEFPHPGAASHDAHQALAEVALRR